MKKIKNKTMLETKDELFEDALKLCLEKNIISSVLIRRCLRVGYARSMLLVEQLKESGKIKFEKYDEKKN